MFHTSILLRLAEVYKQCILRIGWSAASYTCMPMGISLLIHAALFAFAGILAIKALIGKRFSAMEKIMLIGLALLLPLGINFSCLFTGETHALMQYAYCTVHLLALLIIQWGIHNFKISRKGWARLGTGIIVLAIFTGNIQAANAIYVKKDLERQATLSMMTRVADRMEESPEYEAGVTPVAFYAGNTTKPAITGFEKFGKVIGLTSSLTVSYNLTYEWYFNYFLNEPVKLADDKTAMAEIYESAEFKDMPCYPNPGYARMIDGIMVVKLRDIEE